MNLTKMFETQKVLDQKIYDRFPGLKDEPWDWKITALLTELGECANEHRGFKRWSEDQRPRTEVTYDLCGTCGGTGTPFGIPEETDIDCWECGGEGELTRNPLLEEYVDCIHFFISIALELEIEPDDFVVTCDYTRETATQTFNRVFSTVSSLEILMDPETAATITLRDLQETLHEGFSCFVGLGEKFLGFTWEQVEDAYYAKNKINHERQASGY